MNKVAKLPVIAIDGYSSCGKSTVAKALAKKLGLRYVDSGAMYRAVTWYFLQNNIPIPEEGNATNYNYTADLEAIRITFKLIPGNGLGAVYLNEKNVEQDIRTMAVSENVSHVSTIPTVRHRMVQLQQQMRGEGGLVMDGRDIGTTVFPDADLKIFMTADPEVRSMRRFRELKNQGVEVSLEEIRNNINNRDYEDTHRSESPLRRAPDAIVLDNTHLDFDEQLDFVTKALENRS